MTSPSTRAGARFFPGWVVAAAFLLLMADSGLVFRGQVVYLDALTERARERRWKPASAR